jgi:molecular chaperone GrpE (heat shock protein)
MLETPRGGARDVPLDDDDIEILEVVGIDESGAATEEDSDEVELVFEEGTASPVAPAPPVLDAPQADAVGRERFARLAADFDNLKKRLDRERETFEANATRDLVSRLLVVLDNLERAVVAGRESDGDASFRQGVALIHRQLYDELCREGLAAVDAVGETFDPAIHEAVATDTASPFPPNTIVEELQRGYYFRGRLLRPAMVRVALAQSGRDEPGGAGRGV